MSSDRVNNTQPETAYWHILAGMPLLPREAFFLRRFEMVPIIKARLKALNYRPEAIEQQLAARILHPIGDAPLRVEIVKIDGTSFQPEDDHVPPPVQSPDFVALPPPDNERPVGHSTGGFMSAQLPNGGEIRVDAQGRIVASTLVEPAVMTRER